MEKVNWLKRKKKKLFLRPRCKIAVKNSASSCALPRQNKNFIFFRSKIWETDYDFKIPTNKVAKNDTIPPNSYSDNCQNVKRNDGGLPLQSDYLAQIFHQIGAEFS